MSCERYRVSPTLSQFVNMFRILRADLCTGGQTLLNTTFIAGHHIERYVHVIICSPISTNYIWLMHTITIQALQQSVRNSKSIHMALFSTSGTQMMGLRRLSSLRTNWSMMNRLIHDELTGAMSFSTMFQFTIDEHIYFRSFRYTASRSSDTFAPPPIPLNSSESGSPISIRGMSRAMSAKEYLAKTP